MIEEPIEPMAAHDAHVAKNHRLWMPFSIGGLALAGVLTVLLIPELARNFESWMIAILLALAFVLEFVWFFFLSRFKWQLRATTFGIFALSIFCLTMTVRVDGTVNGTGLPKLAWRWTGRSQLSGAAPEVSPAAQPLSTGALESMADVPQFFGPNRDGIVKNARLDRDWKTRPPKQLWRQPIGAGWSAFAVVGGRAYTQEQRGESECVTCYMSA